MRLGVLDVGSNTVHLLVVDAHRGAHPTPKTSDKRELRLTEHLDATGELTVAGADALVRAVERGGAVAAAARLTGAAPSGAGERVRRNLTDVGLRQLAAFITRMSSADLAELEGVSRSRAHRLAAGALVAEAAMRALRVTQLEICPWALREGVILRRLDTLDGTAQIDRSAQDAPERLGRLTTYEARCTG